MLVKLSPMSGDYNAIHFQLGASESANFWLITDILLRPDREYRGAARRDEISDKSCFIPTMSCGEKIQVC